MSNLVEVPAVRGGAARATGSGRMVGRRGMNEAIGFVTVIPAETRGPFMTGHETSEATQQVIDEQVRKLIDAAHSDVTDLLARHRDQLETLARALLKSETLDEADAYAAAGLPSQSPEARDVGPAKPKPLRPLPATAPTRRTSRRGL